MYYIGLDIHKKSISYCVKDAIGQIHQQGKVAATRRDLDGWMQALPKPWTAAMEATIFTGWIYDHLKPHAAAVKVAHPLMLKAIAASKTAGADHPAVAGTSQMAVSGRRTRRRQTVKLDLRTQGRLN